MGIETDRPRVLVTGGLPIVCWRSLPYWRPFISRYRIRGFIPADALQGMVLGYLSHIVADMLTPAGVPLLWPCRWRFRLPILAPRKGNQLERFLCMALFAWAVWMPQSMPGKQRHTLVFADDHYPANAVQSFYKSPDLISKSTPKSFLV
ncbi:membrane protein [Salmonella enterica subsp. enterica]|nr:membrane protein [Salmonella enterica subsp. enterica]